MKATTQGWQDKVVPIAGDCSMEELGIPQEIRRVLVQDTNIILHMAATVSFDAKLCIALRINVLGTKEMMDLARECSNLKAFLHMSTAYSNCYLFEIEEKFYTPPIDMEVVHDLIRADETIELSEEAIKEILGKWPNTYTFTKAIAENLVKDYGQDLPIGIFRPSIVSQSYQEPLQNWSGSFNGAILGLTAAAMGVVHVGFLELSKIADAIPVDMCANAALATAWDIATNEDGFEEPPIYHYATGCDNPGEWRQITEYGFLQVREAPSVKAYWYLWAIVTQNYYLFCILDFFTHFIPAALADLYLLVRGRRRMALETYFKICKYFDVVLYFSNNEWKFDTRRSRALWEKMNATDQQLFFCDVRKMSWEFHTLAYWRGIRVYNLKDPMDTVQEGRLKYGKLRALHYGALSVVAFLSMYLLYKICRLFVLS